MVDVSTPKAPLLVSATEFPNSVWGVGVEDGVAVLQSGPLQTFDVSRPEAPVPLGKTETSLAVRRIIVRDGAYTGAGNKNLDFAGKAITLRSENGAASCTIDCEGSGRGFSFTAGETSATVVEGFAIINGNVADGGGMYCENASPTVLDA